MHSLLRRQLRRVFGEGYEPTPEMQTLLQLVDDAYRTADEDREQIERSLSIASEELFEQNRKLEAELEERKRLERQLLDGEKLRAVGQLSAGVAHEINTPVQFVGDSLTFLAEGFADWTEAIGPPPENNLDLAYLQAEIPQAIERCREGVGRVASIVRALSFLAHPDEQEKLVADLHQAIHATVVVVHNELRDVADVELALEAQPLVLCHVGEVQQVLLNLLTNAGDAVTERYGSSGVRGTIRVATYDEAGTFVMTVTDNGCGMTDDVRARIFEAFFTTKPVGKGSGQGLALVHTMVVRHHGGIVDVVSTPGGGTTFSVRFPRDGAALLQAFALSA